MVEIETRCRIPIWQTFGRIKRHAIPEPRITLHSAATWSIQCHDSRAACHIAGCSHMAKSMSSSCHIARCKNTIRHIENGFSPYFIYYFLGFDKRRLSYRLRYTCLMWHYNCLSKGLINRLTDRPTTNRCTWYFVKTFINDE